jgi:ribulose-phosphate 3-epimerase
MIKVAPSILSADFADMKTAVENLEAYGADYIHCDVMDGVFVPNITFGQIMVKALRQKTSLPLDVHLMIVQPERYTDEFIDAGASLLVVHEEASTHLCRTLQSIKARGVKAGVALNPHTPLTVLEYVYDYLDLVLLMSVSPGFGGQKFIPSSLEKARRLREEIERRGLDIDIEMDGGLSAGNAKEVTDAGVTILVAGNAIFNAPDPAGVIAGMKNPG